MFFIFSFFRILHDNGDFLADITDGGNGPMPVPIRPESDNEEEIKTAKDELQEIVTALTTKMYEQAAQAAQAQQGAEGENASQQDDNVVDAEYEEVNDDEKK